MQKWVLPVTLATGAGVIVYFLTKKKEGTAGAPSAEVQANLAAETPAAVTAGQTRLQQLGYYSGPINGTLSQDYRDAVWGFQFDNNLPQTGVMDLATAQAMAGEAPHAVQGFGDTYIASNGQCYAARF